MLCGLPPILELLFVFPSVEFVKQCCGSWLSGTRVVSIDDMEQRHRLLREQLERDVASSKHGAAAAAAATSPSGKLSWTPAQLASVESDVDAGLGPNLADALRQSIVSACLVQQFAVDRAFEQLVVLEKDDSKAGLLKRMREACQSSFSDLLAATKSVGRMRVQASGQHEQHHDATDELPPPAGALLEAMAALCNNIDSRMRQQHEIAFGALQPAVLSLPAVAATTSKALPPLQTNGRPAVTIFELAEARRRLQAACYSGVPGGASTQLRKIFRWMDADRSGSLGVDEFLKLARKHLKLLPADFSDATARALFDHVDSLGTGGGGGDGNVTLEELEDFLLEAAPASLVQASLEHMPAATAQPPASVAAAAAVTAAVEDGADDADLLMMTSSGPGAGFSSAPPLPPASQQADRAADPDDAAEDMFAIFERLNTANPAPASAAAAAVGGGAAGAEAAGGGGGGGTGLAVSGDHTTFDTATGAGTAQLVDGVEAGAGASVGESGAAVLHDPAAFAEVDLGWPADGCAQCCAAAVVVPAVQ